MTEFEMDFKGFFVAFNPDSHRQGGVPYGFYFLKMTISALSR
jgi:hypothetical protein